MSPSLVLYQPHELQDQLDLPHVRYTTDNGPGLYPLRQPPVLYGLRGLPFVSLAFEGDGTPSYTPYNVRRSPFAEDAPVDIDCLAVW